MSNSAALRVPFRRAPRRPAKASTKPKGQWHHGDLRSSLIAWGTYILDREGTSGMSLRAAAKLAGVSQGAPAHHFGDRNGLLAAIAAQGFRDMLKLRHARLESTDPNDRRARLRAVMLGYVEFALTHPARFHLMLGPEIERRDQYPELVEASAASAQLLRSVVGPFLRSNSRSVLSEEALAFAVWSATHGLATLAIHHGRGLPAKGAHPSVEQFSEIVVQFCLAALDNTNSSPGSDS
jgi:AcrR family transcriptional regulator